jgi:ribosomal protein S18 acetylase RimI-like enzyme
VIDDALGGRGQARLGKLIDVLALPGFTARSDGRVVGVATWQPGVRAELVSLGVLADHRGHGIGGHLLERVVEEARNSGSVAVWLVTTNDNLDALALYQRHGFRLVRLVVGGVDAARELKPQIPHLGQYGIPLRDELVLERALHHNPSP